MLNKHKRLLKIINYILLVIVLFFIAKFLYTNLFSLSSFNLKLNIPLFLLSLTSVWVWLTISSSVFHQIMNKIAPKCTFIENIKIWTTSYLGVYMPGKIGVVTLRILAYQKRGVSAIKVTYGFFVEMVLSVISSVFIVLFSTIFSSFSFINNALPWLIVLFTILLIIIHPKFISLYACIYFKYIKKTDYKYESPYNYFFFIKILCLQLLKWCFAGIGIYILINSVTELSIQYLPFITGLYAAAAILGLLAFFAPSGIGIVEGVMIYGLKSIVSNTNAGIISIFIRLWKVVGELSFIGFIKLLTLLITTNTKQLSNEE